MATSPLRGKMSIPTFGAARGTPTVLALVAWVTLSALNAASAATPAVHPARVESRAAGIALCTAAPAPRFESLLRVERDAETGEWHLASLSQRTEPIGAEAAAVSRSAEGLYEEGLPGGGARIDLQGRFQSLSVASRDRRGGVSVGCVEGALGLFHWLNEEAPVLDAAGRPVR